MSIWDNIKLSESTPHTDYTCPECTSGGVTQLISIADGYFSGVCFLCGLRVKVVIGGDGKWGDGKWIEPYYSSDAEALQKQGLPSGVHKSTPQVVWCLNPICPKNMLKLKLKPYSMKSFT